MIFQKLINKKYLLIITLQTITLLSLISTPCLAQTEKVFYLDSLYGSDTNSGTSKNSAWKSLEKINTTIFKGGDRILLKRGGVWYGGINLRSNNQSKPSIYIGAYGTGKNPLIKGVETVTTPWQKHFGTNIFPTNTHIYKTQLPSNLNITQLFIDGKRTTLARYPNSNYAKITDVPSDTKLKISDFNKILSKYTSTDNLYIKIRTLEWSIIKRKITQYDFQSKNITLDVPLSDSPGIKHRQSWKPSHLKNNGAFLENALYLISENEWFYNPKTGILYVWFPNNDSPSSHLVEYTSQDSIGLKVTQGNFTIENLSFYGYEKGAIISSNKENNLTINKVTINNCNQAGISFYGKNINITDSTISNTSLNAIMLSRGDTAIIQNNQILNSGLGSTIHSTSNGISIDKFATVKIQNNSIIKSGYAGIFVAKISQELTIFKNYINKFTLLLTDGGGIYLGGNVLYKPAITGKITIASNHISDGIGNLNGINLKNKQNSTGGDSTGIYLDWYQGNAQIINNEIHNPTNFGGIFVHGGNNNLIKDNTIYQDHDSAVTIHMSKMYQNNTPLPMNNNQIINNNLYAKKQINKNNNITLKDLNKLDVSSTRKSEFGLFKNNKLHILPTTPSSSKPNPADFNFDGKVDIFDYKLFVKDFGKTGSPGWVKADVNKNGKIDIFDYNLFIENYKNKP